MIFPISLALFARSEKVTIAPSILSLEQLAVRLSTEKRAVTCDRTVCDRTVAISLKSRPWPSTVRLIGRAAGVAIRQVDERRWTIEPSIPSSNLDRRLRERYASLYGEACATVAAPVWRRYQLFPRDRVDQMDEFLARRTALLEESRSSEPTAKGAGILLRLLDGLLPLPAFPWRSQVE